MSLRLRLLLAVGAIAIIALVVADFATYSALRSSLYNQVDQELAAHPQIGFRVNTVTGAVQCPLAPQQLRGDDGRGRPRPRLRPRRRGRGGRLRQHLRDQLRLGRQPERLGRRRPRVSRLRRQEPVPAAAALADHGVHHPAGRIPGGVLHHLVHRIRWPVVPGPGGEGAGRPGGRAGRAARRSDQHPAYPVAHRARRDGRSAGPGPGRWMVVGPTRPPPARGRRADRRFHCRRQSRPARPRRRPGDRGRPSGPRPQRHARTDPGRLLGTRRVRVPAA